jgi:iron(III) transport system ATP-binding protein
MAAVYEGRTALGLDIQGLAHRYGGGSVLAGVNLAVGPGEVHCLVGPSGCGKTTTLGLIAGLLRVQEGRILIGGRLVAAPGVLLPPEARRVGLMFQDFALFPHLTVAENVAFGLASRRRGGRDVRVRALLERVAMAAQARALPETLSGGEQQRVALARALACEPDLMLLDEAFSALDTSLRSQLRVEILDLLTETGTPTLVVTHDPAEAALVGERIHAMRGGRIVQSGAPAELFARPADPFVAGFFGPVHRLSGRVANQRIETALGVVPAAAFPDGTRVELVVRLEAMRLRRPGAGSAPRARVVERRDLGPSCLVRIALADGGVLGVPVVRPDVADVDVEVEITLDPCHVFVYPAAG